MVRRHALLLVEGYLQRDGALVNLVAEQIEALPQAARERTARSAAPESLAGIRHLGYSGLRRLT